MKQGTLITRITMLILFIGVVIYLAFYAAQRLNDPFTTAMAYQDSLNDSVEVSGVLVREESVLSGGAAIMDILPEEGERVRSGQAVAILYQSSDAMERKTQLQSLEQQREQLQSALSSGGSLKDTAKLEQQIIASIQTLHASTAGGDLSALETNAQSLRTQVLQRQFAYSASGDSVASLQQTISELDEQISLLSSQSSYDTTSVYAPCSGLFSGLADGYESTLTPDALDDMTAGQLRELSGGTSPDVGTCVGKLITGDRWYFAAVVDADTAKRLQPGNTITVGFSRDFTGQVDMRVERVGNEEESGCILVLSSDRNLKDVTLLRFQSVELIFAQYTGIRVPKQALRMETQTTTDPDSGQETQTQVLGVYTVVGAQSEFKPVTIVREGSDYYLVQPADSSSTARLRSGDEIIVYATGLYDGKVVVE
jgi:hypothetical protein